MFPLNAPFGVGLSEDDCGRKQLAVFVSKQFILRQNQRAIAESGVECRAHYHKWWWLSNRTIKNENSGLLREALEPHYCGVRPKYCTLSVGYRGPLQRHNN